MSRRNQACWTLLVLLLTADVRAGGLHDLEDAWLVPAARTRALLNDGRTTRGWRLHLAQGTLFGLPELPQRGLAIARRSRRWSALMAWQRLGTDLYGEDQIRGECLIGGRLALGVALGTHLLALEGDAVRRHVTGALRVHAALPADLVLEAWLHLDPSPSWFGQQGLRRWLLLAGGNASWAWAVAADRSVGGQPVVQGEVQVQLTPMASLGLRIEPWSRAVGMVTGWRVGSLLLRTSHLLHPDLGTTHRWGLDLGGGS